MSDDLIWPLKWVTLQDGVATTHEKEPSTPSLWEDALGPAYIRADIFSDPVAVHMNMLCGIIAKPTLAQIAHVYGDEWTTALATARAEGVEQGLRMAADWCDKHHRGELPEHIKSVEGEGIRALIPAPREGNEG